MQFVERHFEDLSGIRCRMYTSEFGTEYHPVALILAFSGTYRIGSEGNGDATYMVGIRRAAMAAWHADALVYDLRELRYEWGNAIWALFQGGFGDGDLRGIPSALVISDLCHDGFSSRCAQVPPKFSDLDLALQHVEKEAVEKLKGDLQVFEGKRRPWWRFW